MVLEQNHFPGATNRWLAPRVDAVCVPSEAARERLGRPRHRHRQPGARRVRRASAPPPGRRCALAARRSAGSRGARSINRAMAAALCRSSAAMRPAAADRAPDRRRGRRARCRPAYARYPALAQAEVARVPRRHAAAPGRGRPGRLPRRRDDAGRARGRGPARRSSCRTRIAADDHQRHNAEAVREAGAAVVHPRRASSTGRGWPPRSRRWLADPARAARMGAAARGLAPARRRGRGSPTSRLGSLERAGTGGARCFVRRAASTSSAIGGSGMSGIAEVLVNLRLSRLRLGPRRRTRRHAGCKRARAREIHRGHRADHVRDADVVVVSSAVQPDNPEVVEARRLKIPVIPRAEMLAELMRMKYGVAVAGAHGKTTTTAMIAEVLDRGRARPDRRHRRPRRQAALGREARAGRDPGRRGRRVRRLVPAR